ncbi:MAG: GAF domain-containing SpoIIE family protein phosphatase [Terriglobales bacterium]|jgi:sigma-B regulation protein RsbU (phosphoserine phosphatase)
MSSGTTDQVLERRVRELLLLQDTAKKVNSILDLEKLLDEIVGGVAEAFGCNRTAVLLQDDARNEMEIIALRGFSNVHLKGYRFKVGGKGMVGHVAATARMHYAPDVRKDPYYVVSESTTLSEVDIPLISRGRLIGLFNAQSSAVDAFAPEQIDLLCALAGNIAAIENARLFGQERLEKEKALREQAEAKHIQRALLPEREPAIPGYAIDGFCLQLNAVGGDWYDYVDLGDGLWGIALGDVCGKGMAAALLMSATRSLFRRAAEGLESPSEVLMRLNQSLQKDLPEGRFVTLVYSILNTRSATVRVANGGHPYPIFVREQTNTTELKTEKGLPLGLMNSEYSEIGLTLQTGDRVLMYTDGVVEAMNSGGQEYGTSRLVKSLQRPGVSAQSVLTEVQEFASGGTLSDDATAIVLRRE